MSLTATGLLDQGAEPEVKLHAASGTPILLAGVPYNRRDPISRFGGGERP
jgi:hypothetical protein